MGTKIRPELSKKNPYWLEKHRYYELKHFCLQYPIWIQSYLDLNGLRSHSINFGTNILKSTFEDPTAQYALKRTFFSERMDMLQKVAKDTDPILGAYILKAVTEGVSYDILKVRLEIPCCKDTYYNLYRRFFWLLSEERQ